MNDIHLEPEKDKFVIKTATYELISSAGKVLAKQTIGGYQGLTLEASDETKAALELFTTSYIKDVQTVLGLLE